MYYSLKTIRQAEIILFHMFHLNLKTCYDFLGSVGLVFNFYIDSVESCFSRSVFCRLVIDMSQEGEQPKDHQTQQAQPIKRKHQISTNFEHKCTQDDLADTSPNPFVTFA